MITRFRAGLSRTLRTGRPSSSSDSGGGGSGNKSGFGGGEYSSGSSFASRFAAAANSAFGAATTTGRGGRGGSGGGNYSNSGFGMSAAGLALLVAGGYFVNNALFNVDGGQRGLKYSRLFGLMDTVYDEGTHFVVPWLETPIIYDVRARPRSVSSLTGTKDLQMVNITLRVLARPQANRLQQIYRSLGLDYDERVLPSITHEVLKSVVAQFNAAQIITQREMVSRMIRESLMLRALKFNIVLDDVSITHVTFSPEFTAAVESKQIAQQEAQRAVFVVERAKQEKESTILRAAGEARAAELLGEALANQQGFLSLKEVETARDIASIISNSKNKIVLSSDALLLNLSKNNTNNSNTNTNTNTNNKR